MNWLVVIDMQNDFISGALESNAAQAVVPNVLQKIKEAEAAGDCIFVTIDTHDDKYLESFEGKHLPISHCIRHTEGWFLESSISKELMNVSKEKLRIICKPTFGASMLLPEMWQQAQIYGLPDTITFVGTRTGICVVSNVMLVKSEFYDQRIVVDAACCSCNTPETHDAALKTMETCQIEIQNWGVEPWRTFEEDKEEDEL